MSEFGAAVLLRFVTRFGWYPGCYFGQMCSNIVTNQPVSIWICQRCLWCHMGRQKFTRPVSCGALGAELPVHFTASKMILEHWSRIMRRSSPVTRTQMVFENPARGELWAAHSESTNIASGGVNRSEVWWFGQKRGLPRRFLANGIPGTFIPKGRLAFRARNILGTELPKTTSQKYPPYHFHY